MQQEDIQQISNLLDQKLDQKFKDNNKILKGEIRTEFKENNKVLKGEIVDEIGVIFSQSFNELEVKIDLIDEKLNLVVDKDDKIIKKQQDFEAEMAANLGAHDRFEETFAKTDKRIKVMEDKLKTKCAAA
ncbi:hypothetical protein KJ586_00380 [Patescibacteria group bacterium]|nr:hypothetical protein [Patescibacteria group bacterium]MBU4347772.1 hypothetical protein [Patescibacteria group bacterium]MBU4454959.1 hypothetical protein [Patescibacteria group bacterium]MCG2690840.1 hypothetical protein [Candidatus Parcubacteria bacterium]